VVASLTPAELRQLVDGVRFIERMRAATTDKDDLPESVTSLREIFMKSVVAARDVPGGEVLRRSDLTVKKPGTGIPAAQLESLVGMRLRRPIERDAQLNWSDVEKVE
jgi:N-acetylneuraminate synthase